MAPMFSRLLRRVHMYLALFLMPWMLMYAVSTIVMNHRREGGPPPGFTRERELPFIPNWPAGTEPAGQARLILEAVQLPGAHRLNASPDGQRLTILRDDPLVPRRITFTPAHQRILIEKQNAGPSFLLERLHRRAGFHHAYPFEDAWATSVDLSILAVVIWSLSGLWLWWEMKRTRALGALCLASGIVLFTFFLARI